MPTLSTVQHWLSEQFIPLLSIAFSLLMGLAMLLVSARSRRSALLRARKGRTEETFAQELAEHGYDSEIARTTYRYLQERQRVGFPIRPMDDLDVDLGLDSEDLQHVIQELLAKVGRSYLPGMLSSPPVTVVDLIRAVQASPRREERVA